LDDVVGTDNAGYGLRLSSYSSAIISSNTTITGYDGDITVNDGYTELTYADFFANDGDVVMNADTGAHIERKD
jgi:hypothetical protein